MLNRFIAIIILTITLASCGGLRAFHEEARAGDTIAVPVGLKADFSRENIAVTITPSSGAPIVYLGTSSEVRAIINMYPDPINNMNVSKAIGSDITPYASTYYDALLGSANWDRDYYQTVLFIDLPETLPVGDTSINVTNTQTGTSHTVNLLIVSGNGTPSTFNSDFNGGLQLTNDMINGLSRAPHKTIQFTDSGVLPDAVEVILSHDPDETLPGGSGKAFAVNPLGDRKNLYWQDDGINLKIILTPTHANLINNINDYKFYVTGTVTNLTITSVKAFDSNGNSLSGISANITSF